jgi:hypothetical protein
MEHEGLRKYEGNIGCKRENRVEIKDGWDTDDAHTLRPKGK